jgi:hypothetical protein
MEPDVLRARVEAAYMGNCRVDDARGAVSWFAEQCNVETNTAHRWMSGDRNPSGPVLAVLRLLEERAASTGWGA